MKEISKGSGGIICRFSKTHSTDHFRAVRIDSGTLTGKRRQTLDRAILVVLSFLEKDSFEILQGLSQPFQSCFIVEVKRLLENISWRLTDIFGRRKNELTS